MGRSREERVKLGSIEILVNDQGCECMRRVKVWRRGDYFDGLGLE